MCRPMIRHTFGVRLYGATIHLFTTQDSDLASAPPLMLGSILADGEAGVVGDGDRTGLDVRLSSTTTSSITTDSVPDLGERDQAFGRIIRFTGWAFRTQTGNLRTDFTRCHESRHIQLPGRACLHEWQHLQQCVPRHSFTQLQEWLRLRRTVISDFMAADSTVAEAIADVND